MLKIVRGRIYHQVLDEMRDMVHSLIGRLDDYALVEVFEKEFAKKIGTKYAKTLPFARLALFEILKYKNFPKGSEVIMPPITIKPMVDIIVMLGLKPVFVDIERDTLCFDEQELKNAINENTKAIFITYLFGIVPDMDTLIQISREANLLIIEDFSHTLNAHYKNKNIGTLGDVSIYSSSSLKTVDSYIGGTIFTNDEDFYIYLNSVVNDLPKMPRIFLFKKVLLNFARNLFSKSFVFTFITSPLLYVIKNANETLYKKILGARLNLKPITQMPEDWTYRFTSLQAKRGLKQLSLVQNVDTAKINNVHFFRKNLGEKFFNLLPTERPESKNVYWQYPLYVTKPDDFIAYMNAHNIDVGLTNLSLCSYLDIYPAFMKETKNAYVVKNNYVFIPLYQGLSQEKLLFIVTIIKNYLDQQK